MITCPSCGGCNEASVRNEQDEIDHLKLGKVKCVVPVWLCHLCGFEWTDHVGESVRDRAVKLAGKS